MAQVFISYAHADNQIFDDEARGWVSNFVDKLEKAIHMKSGGSEVACWMDHRLEPQRAVDETLRQRIRDSQCIIAFMSPRYLESEWCQKEMDTFVTEVSGGAANNRVFLVELLPTERKQWPAGIQSITAVKFWSARWENQAPKILGWPAPKPKADEKYWDELNALADTLARQIKGLPPRIIDSGAIPGKGETGIEKHPEPAPTHLSPLTSTPGKTVWIADPTDDVLELWETLAAELKSQGHGVLPTLPGHYPCTAASLYQQALQADLEQADLLVQLLGGLPGRKPAWAAARFAQLQADAAQASAQRRDMPWLCWRSPDIDLEKVTDTAHRALLQRATPEEFAAFCRQLAERLLQPAPTPTAAPLSVVINADHPDRELGKQVQNLLGEMAVDATLAAQPLPSQAPADYRQHLETQLLESHGVLIVYGVAPPSWVQAQHAQARKVLALHRSGVWGALLEGPPEDKPDHGLSPRQLMLLNCRQGLSAEPLRRFVDTLRQGVARV